MWLAPLKQTPVPPQTHGIRSQIFFNTNHSANQTKKKKKKQNKTKKKTKQKKKTNKQTKQEEEEEQKVLTAYPILKSETQ